MRQSASYGSLARYSSERELHTHTKTLKNVIACVVRQMLCININFHIVWDLHNFCGLSHGDAQQILPGSTVGRACATRRS